MIHMKTVPLPTVVLNYITRYMYSYSYINIIHNLGSRMRTAHINGYSYHLAVSMFTILVILIHVYNSH